VMRTCLLISTLLCAMVSPQSVDAGQPHGRPFLRPARVMGTDGVTGIIRNDAGQPVPLRTANGSIRQIHGTPRAQQRLNTAFQPRRCSDRRCNDRRSLGSFGSHGKGTEGTERTGGGS